MPKVVRSKWTLQFLLWHPEYKKCIYESLDIDRMEAHQPEVIRLWCHKLKKALANYNIVLEDCYNMDEIGFRIQTGRKKRIITRDER